MARPYRLEGKNCFYHITSRGNNRKKIYINESDYKQFLEYLLKAKEKFKFNLYAYVLMPNHYHLLIETLQANLSRIMHYINTSYSTYYNVKRRQCGHLFQGRYKSILVDKDNYFLELTRYIHLNPVRAKMVKSPERYKWSSYNGYIYNTNDDYIDREEINKNLNMGDSEYRKFVLDGIGKSDNPFEKIYAGFILGKPAFIKGKLQDFKKQVENREVSYRKRLKGNIEKEDIIKAVAKRYGKSREELCKMKSRPMQEKKIAIYLIKKFTGLTNNEIGETFGVSYSAVSKAASSVENSIRKSRQIKNEIEKITSSFKV